MLISGGSRIPPAQCRYASNQGIHRCELPDASWSANVAVQRVRRGRPDC